MESAVKARLAKSVSIPVFTDDFVAPSVEFKCFGYCKGPETPNVVPIPDHIFWGWPEVGISDYDSTAKVMLSASELAPEDDRLFWIGNPKTNPTRVTFLEIAAKATDLICGIGMGWQPDGVAPAQPLKTIGQFVSLPDHCRFRYLIDLQARGYSGRTKLLLFSGRTLFIQEREWQEYFFSDLVPFTHYIPVRADLSDLIERLQWARMNSAEASAIARNAQEYALKNLWRSNAVDYLAHCIRSWADPGENQPC
jgi:hypothetical protein